MLEIEFKGQKITDFNWFYLNPDNPEYNITYFYWPQLEKYAYLVYEYWRLKGDFNMLDIKTLHTISNLHNWMIAYIQSNYERLSKKYNIERRKLETDLLNEELAKR